MKNFKRLTPLAIAALAMSLAACATRPPVEATPEPLPADRPAAPRATQFTPQPAALPPPAPEKSALKTDPPAPAAPPPTIPADIKTGLHQLWLQLRALTYTLDSPATRAQQDDARAAWYRAGELRDLADTFDTTPTTQK